MGDVLAGILSALLGQGFTAASAMKLGVCTCMALSAIGSWRRSGEVGLIASDIIRWFA